MRRVVVSLIAIFLVGCATTQSPYMQMDEQYASQYKQGKISYLEYLQHHERLVKQSLMQTNLENQNRSLIMQKPAAGWPPAPEQ